MTTAFAIHLDSGDGPRCGHRRAFYLDTDETRVTCGNCLAHMAGTYHVGVRWADRQPCGTDAAVRWHYRHGEQPCESCRQAQGRRSAAVWARRSR